MTLYVGRTGSKARSVQPERPREAMRRARPANLVWFVVAGVIGAVLVVVVAALLKDDEVDTNVADAATEPSEQAESRLQVAADSVSYSPQYIVVQDDGRSLFIDGDNEYGEGTTVETTATLLRSLGTPQSVVTRMSQTRALDGMQDAEWDGLHASWTYHPDDGLDIIVEEVDE